MKFFYSLCLLMILLPGSLYALDDTNPKHDPQAIKAANNIFRILMSEAKQKKYIDKVWSKISTFTMKKYPHTSPAELASYEKQYREPLRQIFKSNHNRRVNHYLKKFSTDELIKLEEGFMSPAYTRLVQVKSKDELTPQEIKRAKKFVESELYKKHRTELMYVVALEKDIARLRIKPLIAKIVTKIVFTNVKRESDQKAKQ